MGQVILAADIRDSSDTKLLAMSTYYAFKRAGIDVFFLRVGDQKKTLDKQELPYLSVNEIENAVIIAFREISAFINIDRSNVVVYLATSGRIEEFMSYMIHRVDHVVTPDYKTAFQMVSSLKQMGITAPVHRIPPYVDAGTYNRVPLDKIKILAYGPEIIIQSVENCDITYWGSSNFSDWDTVETPKFEDYNVYLHMDVNNAMMVREAMMSGLIPITVNSLPYTEFIIDNLNGFLVSTSEDIAKAVVKLRDAATREAFRLIALKTGSESMSQESWADSFLKTIYGLGAENLNVDNIMKEITPNYRRWLVPKKILQAGKTVTVPRQFNKNRFKIVELTTLKEILTYFSMQKFMDVYIFDWEYNDLDEMDYILNLIRALGRRGLNMYFCTDDPIPDEWADVFKHLAVLPIQEGLKKVKPIPGVAKIS